jgi:hypothetical protein
MLIHNHVLLKQFILPTNLLVLKYPPIFQSHKIINYHLRNHKEEINANKVPLISKNIHQRAIKDIDHNKKNKKRV